MTYFNQIRINMKTIRFMLKLAVLSAALFFSVGNASAYYDPGLQRWLNRDPYEEIGFVTLARLHTIQRNQSQFMKLMSSACGQEDP